MVARIVYESVIDPSAGKLLGTVGTSCIPSGRLTTDAWMPVIGMLDRLVIVPVRVTRKSGVRLSESVGPRMPEVVTDLPAQAKRLLQKADGMHATIVNGQVLLRDNEPTGNLHSEQGREIMELFRKLNEGGTTIVQVTHSEVNAAYGHRVIRLKDGWVVDEK